MAIIAVAVLAALLAGSIATAVRRIRTGVRDSLDLAAKLAVPFPQRVADWPEIRVDEVVLDPEVAARVLVVACWPAREESRHLLVLEVEPPRRLARRLLLSWRDTGASLSPRAAPGDRIVLRRRRTNEVLCADVIAEAMCAPQRFSPRFWTGR
jgi:hypothetical protein